jgi:hypothetical protein
MALSAKERERIIEEEQLRFETRQSLAREHCGKHRPSRWLWWIAGIVILCAVFAHRHCGDGRCPMGYGHATCMHGNGQGWPQGEWKGDGAEKGEPAQPVPPKK